MNNTKGDFLSAEWRKLILMNYVIPPQILLPFLPAGTEPDVWQGNCYISLVGFRFQNTRLRGIRIPFHINFEEVNLRFYVKRSTGDGWKRGVVFIKEMVPKPALSFVANTIYRENYETVPMSYTWMRDEAQQEVIYSWRKGKRWHTMQVTAGTGLKSIAEDSEAAFITEHYWGYARVNERKTTEYEVAHPQWQLYDVLDYGLYADFEKTYGGPLAFLNDQKPASVFLAEGSVIAVKNRVLFGDQQYK